LIMSSPAGGWLRDELDALDHTADNLVLDAGVLSLRVLADGDHVDAVVQRLVALHRLAGTDIREKIEFWKQRN